MTATLVVSDEELDTAVAMLEDHTSFLDGEGSSVRTDYSGRGMYGAECIGIVGSHAVAALFIVALADATDYDHVELLAELVQRNGWQTDSMGLDTIHYFPGIVNANA